MPKAPSVGLLLGVGLLDLIFAPLLLVGIEITPGAKAKVYFQWRR